MTILLNANLVNSTFGLANYWPPFVSRLPLMLDRLPYVSPTHRDKLYSAQALKLKLAQGDDHDPVILCMLNRNMLASSRNSP